MNKKVNYLNSWAEIIDKLGEEERKRNDMLSPNKQEINYLVDYAQNISQQVDKISWTSVLAHEKIIEFDVAQEIIKFKKEELIRNVRHVLTMLEEDNA